LDINSETIKIDAYIWFRWKTCTLIGGDVPHPDVTVSYSNGIDLWGFTTIKSLPECDSLPGYAYTIGRIEATFYQRLNFAAYPLDMQDIFITIEDDVYNSSQLRYVEDPNSSLNIDEKNVPPGWAKKDIFSLNQDKVYDTNWGLSGQDQTVFSTFSVVVTIARTPTVYLFKILLPILIVEFITFAGFWNNIGNTYDTRMATACGSLLAEIFLQLSFSEKLPGGIDLTLMDWIFNIAYFFILFVIVETQYIKNLEKRLQQMEAQAGDQNGQLQNNRQDSLHSRPDSNESISLEEVVDEENQQDLEDLPSNVNTPPKKVKTEAELLRIRMSTIDRVSFVLSSILMPALIFYISLFYYIQQIFLVHKY